nr:MAG: hypothetical protein [Lokiarchaeota virus Ratatoskr Meg22_1012]
MKFLFTGNYSGKIPMEKTYVEELRRRGHEVTVFDTRKILDIKIGYDWEHLLHDIVFPHTRKKYWSYYDKIIDFCENNDIDYYLWWGDKNVHPAVLNDIRKLGVKIIGVCGDDHAGTDYFLHWQPFFDYYLTTDPDKAEKYENGIAFNPCCVLPYVKKLDIAKDIDVLWYGSLYPNRIETLKYLTSNGIDIKVFSSSLGNEVFREELNKLINRARVTLHVNHPDVKIATLRFFEVIGSGNILASDVYPAELFGTEVTYDKEGLLLLIKRILDCPDNWKMEYELVKKHTIGYRVDQFMEAIK